jgi:hypothetical protein
MILFNVSAISNNDTAGDKTTNSASNQAEIIIQSLHT